MGEWVSIMIEAAFALSVCMTFPLLVFPLRDSLEILLIGKPIGPLLGALFATICGRSCPKVCRPEGTSSGGEMPPTTYLDAGDEHPHGECVWRLLFPTLHTKTCQRRVKDLSKTCHRLVAVLSVMFSVFADIFIYIMFCVRQYDRFCIGEIRGCVVCDSVRISGEAAANIRFYVLTFGIITSALGVAILIPSVEMVFGLTGTYAGDVTYVCGVCVCLA